MNSKKILIGLIVLSLLLAALGIWAKSSHIDGYQAFEGKLQECIIERGANCSEVAMASLTAEQLKEYQAYKGANLIFIFAALPLIAAFFISAKYLVKPQESLGRH